jgi:hypothetical protein
VGVNASDAAGDEDGGECERMGLLLLLLCKGGGGECPDDEAADENVGSRDSGSCSCSAW